MARPIKNVVDYFPHFCNHGKTIYILEQYFGNNGYAFWFKLLELLASTENHYLDLKNDVEIEFLSAKMRLSVVETTQILDLLAKLQAIDQELWQNERIIWCQKLVDNIADVYKNRKREVPQKPVSTNKNQVSGSRNYTDDIVSTADNPQSKVKYSKVKKSKVNNNIYNSLPKSLDLTNFHKFWEVYPRKINKATAIKIWSKLNPSPELVETIISAVERAKNSKEWKKDGGQFIPYPSTYLNGRRWEDELTIEEASKYDGIGEGSY